MRRLLIAALAWCWSFGAAAQFASSEPALKHLIVLCYHDVRESAPARNNEFVMQSAELLNQFSWLKENGYVPVTLQQVIAAREGRGTLPDKPVLLTFDDGYRSFYTHVYPLLRLFRYPAVLAVVGSWLDNPRDGATNAPADAPLLTWEEVRVLARSGLVEVASHSYDLHRGVQGNPQGNLWSAATARLHDARSGQYESDADYEKRIRADLARSADGIERRVGVRPRAMVWPYGSYNLTARRIAREVGMDVSLSLEDSAPSSAPFGVHLGRVLLVGNPNMRAFIAEMLRPYKPDPVRAVRVDLDDVYDAEAGAREAKLSRLLDRMAAMGVNTVYLSAGADTDGDGRVDQVYFPSRTLPMRADLFGRVSWQLHTRAKVRVFAWLPVRGIAWPAAPQGAEPVSNDAAVASLYQELARHAPFDGLLFDDSGVAVDDAAYLATTRELLRAVALFRASPRTALAVSAQSLAPVAANDDYAASTLALAQEFDQLVVRAPADGGARNAAMRLASTRVASNKPGRAAIVFELSARDRKLVESLRALQLGGIADLAYGPDDFVRDVPALSQVRRVMSLQSEPR